MMDNPLTPPPKIVIPVYPITVKCVVDCLSEKIDGITKVREYAHSMNIHFMTREYDSKKYSDDRDIITHLPAFHIYVNSCYRNTFYLNTRPYQIIQEIVEKYEASQQRRRNKRTWTSFYTDIRIYVKKLFHRKTAMEKHEENRERNSAKPAREWS
jgi:hypothetical protein